MSSLAAVAAVSMAFFTAWEISIGCKPRLESFPKRDETPSSIRASALSRKPTIPAFIERLIRFGKSTSKALLIGLANRTLPDLVAIFEFAD